MSTFKFENLGHPVKGTASGPTPKVTGVVVTIDALRKAHLNGTHPTDAVIRYDDGGKVVFVRSSKGVAYAQIESDTAETAVFGAVISLPGQVLDELYATVDLRLRQRGGFSDLLSKLRHPYVPSNRIIFDRGDSILPTIEQARALDRVAGFLASDEKFMQFGGYAGSGKTTLCVNIARDARARGFSLQVWAPTNKAARVLGDKLQSALGSEGVETSTAHKGTRAVEEDGTWRFSGRNLENTLVLVDESSMVSKELYDAIHNTVVNSNGAKCIFLGDPFQVEAVGKPSGVLSQRSPVQSIYDCFLTGVLRQAADSTVLAVATACRQKNCCLVPSMSSDDFGVYANPVKFRDGFLSELKAGRSVAMIVATNSKRIEYNNLGRLALYGPECPPLCKGETLISLANSNLYANSTLFKVEDVEPAPMTFEVSLGARGFEKTYTVVRAVVKVIEGGRPWKVVVYLFPDIDKPGVTHKQIGYGLSQQYRRVLTDLGDIPGDNNDMFGWNMPSNKAPQTSVVIATYGYAITAHKAQGSQWESVWVDQNYCPPDSNPARWYYTAITRASQKVEVLKRPHLVRIDADQVKADIRAVTPKFVDPNPGNLQPPAKIDTNDIWDQPTEPQKPGPPPPPPTPPPTKEELDEDFPPGLFDM